MQEQQVYQTYIQDVNDVKHCLLDVWAAVNQRIIYYFVSDGPSLFHRRGI